ncbi:hypothetical protein AJ79_08554 [Helicocarpus griseus UAMH5409]|uniref:Glycosyl transferase CAP10 domain-containing protein n=1 Tax=Helicocarpus griseus UAMH5409 TaxID=1447875 RepID=A0A2B7WSA4_9EURO|nr:hypothetical protein AJ79_08554 [Helicocarpus griseus UAMH5409]
MSLRQRLSARSVLPWLAALFGAFVFSMWFGMNSDRDNVHPLLNQLIPAGHCACQQSTTFNCSSCLAPLYDPISSANESSQQWTFQYGRDDRNEGLHRDQCQAAFPGLFEDINRAVEFWKSRGGITRRDLDKISLRNGMARGMIYEGELRALETKAAQEDHRRKILAIFSAIHRALPLDRSDLPNIEFIFSIEDKVEDVLGNGQPLWTLGRTATEESVWLMPDFGFWAWDNPRISIGPYSEVVGRIKKREDTIPWSSKEKKLVWRGKLSFAPKLRRRLLEVAKSKPWGDVKELVWSRKDNLISMEDHCRYMFIAHVEGRAFSSSLKYRQACRSVIVAHKLQFLQHHHYLLQADGPQQNYVEVERDFSDLSQKIEELLADEARARLIADNNVRVFRERYLTKAAEACYWRELMNGWAEVFSNNDNNTRNKGDGNNGTRNNNNNNNNNSNSGGGGAQPDTADAPDTWAPDGLGVRYESFILLESKDMMLFSDRA